MGCEWLAGLVWEGLGGLRMGCEWLAGLVSRVCVYVDWRGWVIYGWSITTIKSNITFKMPNSPKNLIFIAGIMELYNIYYYYVAIGHS